MPKREVHRDEYRGICSKKEKKNFFFLNAIIFPLF